MGEKTLTQQAASSNLLISPQFFILAIPTSRGSSPWEMIHSRALSRFLRWPHKVRPKVKLVAAGPCRPRPCRGIVHLENEDSPSSEKNVPPNNSFPAFNQLDRMKYGLAMPHIHGHPEEKNLIMPQRTSNGDISSFATATLCLHSTPLKVPSKSLYDFPVPIILHLRSKT